MDIQVKNRKPQCEWLRLGVQGDNNVELVRFILPRFTGNQVDLYLGMAYVGFVLPDGSEHLVPITENYKEATDDNVALSWIVGNEATAQPGRISIAIKISGLEGELWKSEKAYCTVAATIPMESTQPEIFRSTYISSNVVVLPRIANPDTEPPITISERTIIVPQELQNIAVQNDQNSETVKIVCPRYFDGNDLSQYDFYLHTISTGGENPDIVFLGENKVVGQTEVTLKWTLRPPETSYAGRLTIQLKILGINFQWSTDSTSVNIIRYQEGDPVIPVTPSFVDEFLKEITVIRNSAKESQVAANISEKNAETSAANAKNSANESKKFSDNATESANNAKTSKENADAAALAAKTSETKAATSVQSAKDEVDKAKKEADRAKNEADRSKAEADRAAGIVGGDFANKVKDATAGNLVVLTAVGDIADSGKGLDDVGKVKSVFGRDGDVVAEDGDYAAAQVSCVPAKVIQEENVQGAINYISDHYLPEKIDEFVIKPSNPQDYTAPLACLLRPSFQGRTVQDGTPSPEHPAPIKGVLNPWARAYTGEPVEIDTRVPVNAAVVEPLMMLPDGTCDQVAHRDGHWGLDRKILKEVFNGTENWYASDNGITYWTKSHIAGVSTDNIFCDRFISTNNIDNPPVNSVFSWCEYSDNSRFTGTIFVVPSESIVPRSNVEALKSWLATNPVTVYGPAATPTFEPIPAWNTYGKINPIAVTTTITKPNPDAPISPDNVATITGTPVVTTGYRGLVRQLEGEMSSLPDGAADEFDKVNYTQKILGLELTGTDADGKYDADAQTKDTVAVWVVPSGLKLSESTQAGTGLLCSHFAAYQQAYWPTVPQGIFADYINGFFFFMVPKTLIGWQAGWGDEQTVPAFKSWIASQRAAGTPVKVYLSLAVPVTTRHDLDLPLSPGTWTIECGDDNGLLNNMSVEVLPDPNTYGNRIYPYAHVKVGTVHQLTGTPGATEISFAATAPYLDGDTWTVNGAPVAATYTDGQALFPTAVITGESVRAVLEGDVMRLLVAKPTPQKNLLDNADLRKPVNQRELTIYQGPGYTIDRWLLWNAETSITLKDGYIELSPAGNAGESALVQFIGSQITRVGTYTITITAEGRVGIDYYDDDTGAHRVYAGESGKKATVSFTYTIDHDVKNRGNRVSIINGHQTENIKIYRVKLEPGPRFTGWCDPKPGETLAECQRYLECLFRGNHDYAVPISEYNEHNAVARTSLGVQISLSVTKRVVPALLTVGDGDYGRIVCINADGYIMIFIRCIDMRLYSAGCDEKNIMLQLLLAEPIPQDAKYVTYDTFGTSRSIFVDANIY